MSDFYCLVENVYFSVSFSSNYWNGKPRDYEEFFNIYMLKTMEDIRQKSLSEELIIMDNIEVISGIKRYPYGFKVQDKFRIYIAKNIGDNYPIICIVNAHYLHTENVYNVMNDVYLTVKRLYEYLCKGIEFNRFYRKINRIDICNHNTRINLSNYIKLNEKNSRVVTRLKECFSHIDLVGQYGLNEDYYRYGKGSLVVRFYNKVKEICEMRYKAFFFLKWLDYGLIDIKTFNVYDMTYKLGNNYHLDFLYSNIVFSDIENIKKIAAKKIYYDKKLGNSEKYDSLLEIVNSNKIKLVKEVVNVEYQLRSDFLKTIRLKDDKGNIYKYDNVEDIFKGIQILYKYLTNNSFRVIKRGKNYKRKRDTPVDSIWKCVQESKVLNIDKKFSDEKLSLYREYQNKHDILDTFRKASKSLARYYYLKEINITKEDIKKVTPEQILSDFVSGFIMNENYFEIKERLEKQIIYHGEKKKIK